jgi:hypothetical protein
MGEVVDLGYSLKVVKREDFDERLRVIRVVYRQRLEPRSIKRDGKALGTVYLVGEVPVAFYDVDGVYYLRST